jgi:hypothetical protein
VIVVTVLEDPEASRLYVCRVLAVICGVNETCGVKEAVSTAVYVRAVDGLDVREADGMAVIDCGGDIEELKVAVLVEETVRLDVAQTDRIVVADSCGEEDMLKAGVGLEETFGLADEDSTDGGEGVAVSQGVLTRESDSEFVTDVKGVCEGVAV